MEMRTTSYHLSFLVPLQVQLWYYGKYARVVANVEMQTATSSASWQLQVQYPLYYNGRLASSNGMEMQ